MAIELQVSSVTALVTSEPRERQIYDGRGDNRTVKGRFTDAEGRPVSTVNAVVVAEPVGLLPDAQVQLPDIQAKSLVPGAVVRVEGSTIARLTGAPRRAGQASQPRQGRPDHACETECSAGAPAMAAGGRPA